MKTNNIKQNDNTPIVLGDILTVPSQSEELPASKRKPKLPAGYSTEPAAEEPEEDPMEMLQRTNPRHISESVSNSLPPAISVPSSPEIDHRNFSRNNSTEGHLSELLIDSYNRGVADGKKSVEKSSEKVEHELVELSCVCESATSPKSFSSEFSVLFKVKGVDINEDSITILYSQFSEEGEPPIIVKPPMMRELVLRYKQKDYPVIYAGCRCNIAGINTISFLIQQLS